MDISDKVSANYITNHKLNYSMKKILVALSVLLLVAVFIIKVANAQGNQQDMKKSPTESKMNCCKTPDAGCAMMTDTTKCKGMKSDTTACKKKCSEMKTGMKDCDKTKCDKMTKK